jgi:hypothetical protein
MTKSETKYGSGSVFEPASSNEDPFTNLELEKDLEKDPEMNPILEPGSNTGTDSFLDL